MKESGSLVLAARINPLLTCPFQPLLQAALMYVANASAALAWCAQWLVFGIKGISSTYTTNTALQFVGIRGILLECGSIHVESAERGYRKFGCGVPRGKLKQVYQNRL